MKKSAMQIIRAGVMSIMRHCMQIPSADQMLFQQHEITTEKLLHMWDFLSLTGLTGAACDCCRKKIPLPWWSGHQSRRTSLWLRSQTRPGKPRALPLEGEGLDLLPNQSSWAQSNPAGLRQVCTTVEQPLFFLCANYILFTEQVTCSILSPSPSAH